MLVSKGCVFLVEKGGETLKVPWSHTQELRLTIPQSTRKTILKQHMFFLVVLESTPFDN